MQSSFCAHSFLQKSIVTPSIFLEFTLNKLLADGLQKPVPTNSNISSSHIKANHEKYEQKHIFRRSFNKTLPSNSKIRTNLFEFVYFQHRLLALLTNNDCHF